MSSRSQSVYAPVGRRGLATRDRFRALWDAERSGADPIHHWPDAVDDPPLTLDVRRVIAAARTVLVVSDGVANAILESPSLANAFVWLLHPRSCCIALERLPGGIACRPSQDGALYVRSYLRLPGFDLLISGCDWWNDQGFVFTRCGSLTWAYQQLRQCGKIGSTTVRLLIAAGEQLVRRDRDRMYFMRAHHAMTEAGGHHFEWGHLPTEGSH